MRVYTFESSGPALIPEGESDNPSGPRMGWGNALPTVGYWKKGDVFVAEEILYICTVEGTPGTWATIATAVAGAVTITGAQSIAGAKTFTDVMTVNGTDTGIRVLGPSTDIQIGGAETENSMSMIRIKQASDLDNSARILVESFDGLSYMRIQASQGSATIAGHDDAGGDWDIGNTGGGELMLQFTNSNTSTYFRIESTGTVRAEGHPLALSSSDGVTVDGFPVGRKVAVPASAVAAGLVGDFAASATFFYVCVAVNTWVRCALATW